jgi:hypothetical protein
MSVDARHQQVAVGALDIVEEPLGQRERWRREILCGRDLGDAVRAPDGVAGWLWARWPALPSLGVDAEGFRSLLLDYRREIWFWLEGDRTWEQCCTGLAGRIGRRLGTQGAPQRSTWLVGSE